MNLQKQTQRDDGSIRQRLLVVITGIRGSIYIREPLLAAERERAGAEELNSENQDLDWKMFKFDS